VEADSPSRGHAPYPQWPPRSYQHRDSSRRALDDDRQLAGCDALASLPGSGRSSPAATGREPRRLL